MWKKILSSKPDNSYSVGDFFEFRGFFSNPVLMEYRQLVSTQRNHENPTLHLLDTLNVKYKLELSKNSVVEFSKAIIESVIGKNCKKIGYWTHKDVFEIEFRDGCIGFNKNIMVSKINGQDLFSNVDNLLNITSKKCKTLILTHGSSKNEVALKCPDNWPDSNNYRELKFDY